MPMFVDLGGSTPFSFFIIMIYIYIYINPKRRQNKHLMLALSTCNDKIWSMIAWGHIVKDVGYVPTIFQETSCTECQTHVRHRHAFDMNNFDTGHSQCTTTDTIRTLLRYVRTFVTEYPNDRFHYFVFTSRRNNLGSWNARFLRNGADKAYNKTAWNCNSEVGLIARPMG